MTAVVVLWVAAMAIGWSVDAQPAAPHTDSLTGVAGEATVLPCGGDPLRADPAAVTWHRRPKGGSTVPAVGAGFQLRGDGSLWLARLEPDHEGRFTCTDATTDRLIAVYDLKVRKPSVIRIESNAESGPLSEGDTFRLTCRVLTDSASHAATMLVWRDDTLVAPDDPRVTLRTQRTRNVWQLSIANVTRADAGSYICRAKTYFDRAEASAQLMVAPRVAADCTSSSAELRWSADAPSPGGFIVRMTVGGAVADEALVPADMRSVDVSDLEPGSQVRFEVKPAEEGAVEGTASCFVPPETAEAPPENDT
ncbi:roundabout homolog 1-like [Amphibalanus amphitrite]|uniref:roundabout homolog 1-like n=1 Tax=Amphibalanus amphitrite TaxID=1232801 RepID=UPI001C90E2BB|nr:roundabout homolog 1-like [Amphibalanus amphitrite]